MALSSALGALTWNAADAATTTYVVTGLGFQPKALQCWIMGQASAVDAASGVLSGRVSIGMAAGTADRRCVCLLDTDAVTDPETATAHRNDAVLVTVDAAGAIDGRLDLSAIGSDGFTLIVDDQGVVDLTVFWQAWGGADLTNVETLDIVEPGATGTVDYGTFAPDVVLFAGCQANVANTGRHEAAGLMFGAATGSSREQFVCATNSDDASGTADTDRYARGDECLALIALAGGNPDVRATYQGTVVADTFRLNWLARTAEARRFIALAIKGGQWAAGSVVVSTTTTVVSGLAFQPAGGLVASNGGTVENTAGSGGGLGALALGAFLGTSNERSMTYRTADGTADAEVNLAIDYDKVSIRASATGGVVYTLDVTAIAADGFTLVRDAATGSYNGYLVYADEPGGSIKPWLYRLHTQTIVASAHLAGLFVAMTHNMGIGGVSTSAARYRARAASGALLQVEYSTNSDLTGSTTTAGVVVDATTDYTGGESLTGLSATTQYYYVPRVNGARGHDAPYPSFRTAPSGAADLVVAWGSCMLAPDEPDIFASMAGESPHLFIHLGDFGYPDSSDLTVQRNNYKTQYASQFDTHIVRQMARAHTWDDHDYGENNSDGDQPGKATSLQVFQEYIPSHDFANPTQGVWRSFVVGDIEFFILDTRYQREGNKFRFPSSAGTTNVADTGSSGDQLVLRAANGPSGTNDHYTTWYVEVAGVVRRVLDYVGATRTCTLTGPVSGLDSSSTYYLRKASLLDMNAIADGQIPWLIAGVNGSSARWKVICSSVVWNPTFTDADALDSWCGWDADQIERKYLSQEITAANVIILSGDRHASGLDDGTNSLWPEACSSPLDQNNLDIGGTWSHGTFNTDLDYGLATFDASAGSVTLTIKNKLGTTATGITPMTILAA